MRASRSALTRWTSLPQPLRVLITFATAIGLAAYALVVAGPTAHAAPTLLSQGKTATASSVNAGNQASFAVDGNTGTRWESAWSDPQWLQVDLGGTATISQVVLQWESASGKAYQIQTSNDAVNWTSIYSTTTGPGGTETLNVTGSGRYVRMYGTVRNTGYGYSLWEFQVFGTMGASCGGTNAALNQPATASSVNAANQASFAVDGNTGTRWESAWADPQWLQVDLGSSVNVCQVVIQWETASGKAYQIQTSNDAVNWTSIYSTTTGPGGTETLNISGTGRYIRMYGTARNTGYGYSIWEFQVFTTGGSPSPSPSASASASPSPSASSTGGTGNCTDPVISAFQPVAASSYNGANAPAAALDGRTTTRWESQYSDPQWLQVDLGGPATITCVGLNWETAYASAFQIQVSSDAVNWTSIYSTSTGTGGIQTLNVSGSGRYVRMYGTARATGYGYSLWEFQVHGTVNASGSTPTILSPPTKAPATTGQFALSAPADNAMVTNTRRPAFTWAAVSGAAHYQVWINISRTDYDWTASGNLLDWYTKVAEPTGTSYTPTWDLPDRWTYKWFVVAVSGTNTTTTSNIQTFSLYLPTVSTVSDGVPVINGMRDLNKDGVIEPYEDWHQPIATRVNDLLSRMTAQEKAYQMFYNNQVYPQSGWIFGPAQPNDLNNYLLASSGTRLGIPPIAAGDTIMGYQTTYPAQSALAAGRDYPLDYKLGNMQRQEEVQAGARGVLGPLAELGTKVIYPRIQEGNGENADVAAAQVRALIAGLQGGPELNDQSVLVTVKHWPGEGAGGESGITYDATTIKYTMIPWTAAIEANAGSIMTGYAGAAYLDPTGTGAGNSAPIINYLRQNMGYTGLITTDWLPYGGWISAAQAGADVMGGADPGSTGFSMTDFMNQVPQSRIDDSVRQILTVKFKLGLFDNPYGDPANAPYRFHQPSYVALANQASRESMTLLKNDGVLPVKLNAGDNIVVTGARGADGPACCLWTSYFHPEYGSLDFLDAIKARAAQAGVNVYQDTSPTTPKLAIVAVGEASYTHATNWPNTQPYLPPDQVSIIQNFKNQGIPVVVLLVLPRPYVISDWNGLADAVVVTYRGGEEMGPAAASLLFGDYTPSGKLPWQLPANTGQVLTGGLTDTLADAVDHWDLPYDMGATSAEITDIRSHIAAGQSVPTTYGTPLYPYGAGLQGWH
ncbi:MAG TPA: discoidin domain-containing protein [Actinocrinis sp.]|uniref:discoidin domain-containing protein n=1 Tax=Actinocrinis sp. TaxID=1920516 RepID=UPI002DDCAFBC|nr:discoidin domain-containing protein [Actinocrinis sp.]HEV2345441.1 discoidin domain-containing protein [Actinocrinis sp.]